MSTFVVLASGPSVNQAIADFVRDKCKVVAVSNAYILAPWADALVSNDSQWWRTNCDALNFAGRKFSGASMHGTERLRVEGNYPSGCNSGLQGMRVATMLGATKILLLGFDMHAKNGHHFFGKHPSPLRNTTESRFKVHIDQFRRWRGPKVVNCTPGSALTQFPMSTIEKELHESLAEPAIHRIGTLQNIHAGA